MDEKYNLKKKLKIQILLLSLLLVVVLFFAHCTIRYHKEKIWNLQDKVVDLAKTLVGSVYRYGGEDIDGFDCSGYVWYVYNCYGIDIPRTARKQKSAGRRVSRRKSLPGDVVVFKLKGRFHTGILLSNNSFSHSPKKGDRIRVEQINQFWERKLVCIVRVID
jgi:cell wall-associated NlpC family hydrolase